MATIAVSSSSETVGTSNGITLVDVLQSNITEQIGSFFNVNTITTESKTVVGTYNGLTQMITYAETSGDPIIPAATSNNASSSSTSSTYWVTG